MIGKTNPPRSANGGFGETLPTATPAALGSAKTASPAVWTGLYLGALLNVVMIAALVAANRFSNLEPYALERNAASYGLFVLFLLIPVVRFLNRPVQMFNAGMIGWVLFVAGYDLAGLFFHNLFNVLRTPFEALIEGAVLYGVAAVLCWVVGMILLARRHPIAPRRRAAEHVVHDRP
jgi:hypothetical protein